MSNFALIANGAVLETAAAEFPVNPAFTWVDITAVSPEPMPGWTFDGTAFHAPAALPAPSLAAQAAALLAGGLTVTSTGTSTLNGVYACDATAQQHISAELISVMLNGTFADGTGTVQWQDISGALHGFTVAQWKPLAVAIGVFVAAAIKVQIGASTTLPTASATIP